MDKNAKKAQVQLDQAKAFEKQGKLEDAIKVYRSMKREDSPELHAKGQFNLGFALYDQDETREAIDIWSEIKEDDSKEAFAAAQYMLGYISKDLEGKIQKAINIWEAVDKPQENESPRQYVLAQFNLGRARWFKGDLIQSEAMDEFKIHEGKNFNSAEEKEIDNQKINDKGRNGIKEKEEAAKAYLNITNSLIKSMKSYPELYQEFYAEAQFNLGVVLAELSNGETIKDRFDEAVKAYRRVPEDSQELYANAQFNLGVILARKGSFNDACAAYGRVPKDSQEFYAEAQFNLGDILAREKKFDKAIEIYKSLENEYFYRARSRVMILESAGDAKRELENIGNIIDYVMSILFIPFDKDNSREHKVAHYTRAKTAGKIIDTKSPFRLSTIKGVNDPTEGKVLDQYLGNLLNHNGENFSLLEKGAFVSCFTFNHDSLNQFRLYGKEGGQEASGVSLVFNKSFFNLDLGKMFSFVGGDTSDEKTTSDQERCQTKNYNKPELMPKMADESNYSDNKESRKRSELKKLPLYRCIYIDPESLYLSLAHRDKITFYREVLLSNGSPIDEELSEDWKEYKDGVVKKRESIKRSLKHILDLINIIKDKGKDKDLYTLNFLLMPLRYLVKHAAFEEEQECRMVFISHLGDEKINLDWDAQQMYIDYEADVSENIDKMYLSPGAAPYEDFFRIRLDKENQKKSKVRHSMNPFRSKK